MLLGERARLRLVFSICQNTGSMPNVIGGCVDCNHIYIANAVTLHS